MRDISLAKSVPALTKENVRALILCFLKERNIATHLAPISKKIAPMFHRKTLSYERTIIVILLFGAHQNSEKS
ncbi:hypothetical protein L0337_38945 [candidate division KSB1 bacterium]|nr:hypothetical protein [candidate division KSB1 bacterium]